MIDKFPRINENLHFEKDYFEKKIEELDIDSTDTIRLDQNMIGSIIDTLIHANFHLIKLLTTRSGHNDPNPRKYLV